MAEKKASAGRRKGFILAFLLFGPAFLLIFISSRGCEHKFKELDDLGEMTPYSFKNIEGKTLSNKDFTNQVVLFTTIQVTCPDSCAITLWHFDQIIYQHLRKNQKKLRNLKIISFVTDGNGKPANDLKTVEAILKDQFEEYDPSIWILAKGDAKSLFDISRNGENLLQEGDTYFGGQAFTELMLLVDKSNHLRMVLNGKSEGMVRRMKEYMALLDKQYDKKAKSKK
jgi:cytochrome oxidase Cu insertion factor (SCO1/SenC/PrrC family)